MKKLRLIMNAITKLFRVLIPIYSYETSRAEQGSIPFAKTKQTKWEANISVSVNGYSKKNNKLSMRDFTRGMGTVLDLYGQQLNSLERRRLKGFEADKAALSGDWQRVGGYFTTVIKAYEDGTQRP